MSLTCRGVTLPTSEMWPVNEVLLPQRKMIRVERGMYTLQTSLFPGKKRQEPPSWSVDENNTKRGVLKFLLSAYK